MDIIKEKIIKISVVRISRNQVENENMKYEIKEEECTNNVIMSLICLLFVEK
jgi:hypothetical protein